MSKTYRIIPDSNFVWQDSGPLDRPFNSNMKDILGFLKQEKIDNKVTLRIPAVTVEERITQQCTLADQAAKNIDSEFSKLKVFGVKAPKGHKKSYRKLISQKAYEELKAMGVTVISIPDIKHKDILKRALERVKPFGKQDKGYKDTLMWLSILEEAKENPNDHFIICTRNKDDFDLDALSPEFKKASSKNIVTVPDVNGLKELLDKEFGLSLDLKKLHQEITNEIRANHMGDLVAALNAELSPGLTSNFRSLSALSVASVTRFNSVGGYEISEDDISSYSARDIRLNNISGDDPYRINAVIDVHVHYNEKNKNQNGGYGADLIFNTDFTAYSHLNGGSLRQSVKSIPISFSYNRKDKSVKVHSINGLLALHTI